MVFHGHVSDSMSTEDYARNNIETYRKETVCDPWEQVCTKILTVSYAESVKKSTFSKR